MPDGIVLRRAVPPDAEALTRVHLASWRETYPGLLSAGFLAGLEPGPRLRFWQRALDTQSPARTWLVEDRTGPDRAGPDQGARVVGFASTRPAGRGEPRELELWGIHLLAERQRQGLGQRLWQAAVGNRSCLLWVAEQNIPAQAFYRRQGLAPDGGRDVAGWMEDLPVIRMVR